MDVAGELNEANIAKVMEDVCTSMGFSSVPQDLGKEHTLPFRGKVYTDAYYARFVEYGTRPALGANTTLEEICKDKENKRF